MAKLERAIREHASSAFVENLSNAIASRRVDDLIAKAEACGWSFAYTQFLTDKYRYSVDS